MAGGQYGNRRTNNWCGIDRETEDIFGMIEAKRFEGKKLSLPSNWLLNLENSSLQRNLQANIGSYKEKI